MKLCMRIFLLFAAVSFAMPKVGADFKPTKYPESYILQDYDTGTVMAEYKADEARHIASVTKVMTMLLCMEAVNAGKVSFDDVVTASEYACGMGGSQIYLKPGEQMSLRDMLKAIAVGSANDASVAVAEHIMGSEESFVGVMNERARALGMSNTHFENCNGLGGENHYSTARDVAIMSRELLKHEEIKEFLTIWTDSVRDGKFGLANTNKLIRFYDGAIGIKTGYTSEAKYCLSAAAKRDGMTLISVVLGAETSAERFSTSKELLNYGFANYKISVAVAKDEVLGTVKVGKGTVPEVTAVAQSHFLVLTDKQSGKEAAYALNYNKDIKAPIKKGDIIGKAEIRLNGKKVGEVNAVAAEEVAKMSVGGNFSKLLKLWFWK